MSNRNEVEASRLGERLVVPFQELRMQDVDSVGGKNA